MLGNIQCFRIIHVSTLVWLQEIHDACIEHIKCTVDIFSIRCFQTIWIIGVMNGSQKYSSKEQVRGVCEALHACYVGVHLTCAHATVFDFSFK